MKIGRIMVWAGSALFFILQIALAAYADEAKSETKPAEPFAFADFTWLNGSPRQKDFPLDGKYFSGEFRTDVNYAYSFNQPSDHTLSGSCELGRHDEFQLQQLGIGGDFHWQNVRGRLMTQFGMYSTMTPRNDASPSRGQWSLADAYKYLAEAYGGYHLDVWNGINIDAGLFMSYVGLFSYYNYDNWAYQPSYVSANTPWFFNGIRIQIFPSDRFKQEFWITNGWQSYGMFNESPGIGSQTLWRPNGDISVLSNNYLLGYDQLGKSARRRIHTDNSATVKYYDKEMNAIDKAAFSITGDAGCETGGDTDCSRTNFLGFMLYNRVWFNHDRYAMTVGGGYITNPGRYLALVPPVNGATAATGAYDFSQDPGDPLHCWDASLTFDYMPSQFITFRAEYDHRHSDVPYFVGQGGITPPGGNKGTVGSQVPGFTPDLVNDEDRVYFAMLVKF